MFIGEARRGLDESGLASISPAFGFYESVVVVKDLLSVFLLSFVFWIGNREDELLSALVQARRWAGAW